MLTLRWWKMGMQHSSFLWMLVMTNHAFIGLRKEKWRGWRDKSVRSSKWGLRDANLKRRRRKSQGDWEEKQEGGGAWGRRSKAKEKHLSCHQPAMTDKIRDTSLSGRLALKATVLYRMHEQSARVNSLATRGSSFSRLLFSFFLPLFFLFTIC